MRGKRTLRHAIAAAFVAGVGGITFEKVAFPVTKSAMSLR
jgi:hypothetical protein